MTSDREKIYAIAEALGDEIYETQMSFAYIPAWGKKFKFNPDGEIIKVQVPTKSNNFKTVSIDPEYESAERAEAEKSLEEAE